MTIVQLFEEENMLLEKSLAALNKKRQRRLERDKEEEEKRKHPELTPEMKRKLRAHKHPDWKEDGRVKFKSGRERTVAAVRNLCKAKGKSITTGQARDYIYKCFVQWENREKSAKWILHLEDVVKKKFGYDPRKYAHINKGDTVGLGGKGDPEYKGRAYFFTALINGFANHFINGEDNKMKPWKDARKKHKKAVKARKAKAKIKSGE